MHKTTKEKRIPTKKPNDDGEVIIKQHASATCHSSTLDSVKSVELGLEQQNTGNSVKELNASVSIHESTRDSTETKQADKPKKIPKGRSKHKAKQIHILEEESVGSRSKGDTNLNRPISNTSVSSVQDSMNNGPQCLPNEENLKLNKPQPAIVTSNEPERDAEVAFKSPRAALEHLASKADEKRLESEIRLHSTVASSLDILRKGLLKPKPKLTLSSSQIIQEVVLPQMETASLQQKNEPSFRIIDSQDASLSSIENVSMSLRTSIPNEGSFGMDPEEMELQELKKLMASKPSMHVAKESVRPSLSVFLISKMH